ncbi:MAG: alpha/beta hydrolase [candidate division Zixibacteria bacterium]
MAFYDANDAAIYYEIEGDGPPLVLLHGYALNGAMWEFQKSVLAKSHKVITVDLRGFGQSSCGKRWSSSIMAEDIIGMISSLNLADVAILGFSMSGPAAFRIAYEMPDVVTKLIMVSSILPSSGRLKARKEKELQEQELNILRLRGVKEWGKQMGLLSGPLVDNIFKRNPESRPLWERMISRHNPDYLLCMMSARQTTSPSVNWRAKLNEIKQPTLIIAGAQDSQFLDSARYLSRNIINSRLEIISGAGHRVNLEAPEEFDRVISVFLK